MSTYDLSFARKFSEIAGEAISREPDDVETRRVVAYMSRLSMELSLKAFLEKVNVPVEEIKKHGHDLRSLLKEVGKCEVEIEISPGTRRWVPATRIRAIEVLFQGHPPTLGVILAAEDHGASKYPNELRYGEMLKDFPPEALSRASEALVGWVGEHSTTARKKG